MKTRRMSIRNKILVLAAGVSSPFIIMAITLLFIMHSYSREYEKLVSDLTVANKYNITFKEQMDESVYKLVVGSTDFEQIGKEQGLKNPYVLIQSAREDFTALREATKDEGCIVWLESLLRNLDTLEKRVQDVEASVETGGTYDENIEELDNNIYILTELIQEDIQYYSYYQTNSIGKMSLKLNEQANRFMIVATLTVIVLTVVAFLVAFAIVNGILEPFHTLKKSTDAVKNGDFSIRANVHSGDEVEELANSFDDMAENMEGLISKIKEDERKMRRSELRLLQEQINPHFLYNTLDALVWLIEGNENDRAVEMVVTLSGFFRMVLSKGKEFITIQEEEKHISSYLSIQEIRYHDIMEYDIQIDKVIYDYMIPKLTLQPIVENALYHGLKEKRAKGFIHINGEKDGNDIIFRVRDDGVGMNSDELQALRQEISRPCQETQKGFGLANVNERLRIYYGAEYGLQIFSEKGEGTWVEVRIPAIKKDSPEMKE